MRSLFAIVTIIGSLIGGAILWNTLFSSSSSSALQEGLTAAVAVGLAVIPYCIARSLEMLGNDSEEIRTSLKESEQHLNRIENVVVNLAEIVAEMERTGKKIQEQDAGVVLTSSEKGQGTN